MEGQHTPFGAVCVDKVSKFRGVVIGYARHLTGCDQVCIVSQSQKSKQGKRLWVDHARVTQVGLNQTIVDIAASCVPTNPELELGAVAQCVATGHRGTITSMAEHVGYSCRDYYIVPLHREDDEQETGWYPDTRLALVDAEEKVEPEDVQERNNPGPDTDAMESLSGGIPVGQMTVFHGGNHEVPR